MTKLKFYGYTIMAFLLTAIILSFPADCLSFSLNGLNLWFERMIPTLFPFMVLSGIIIRMNLTGSFVRLLNPLFARIFRVNSDCIYGIVIGFLCGFPMGAHVASQLYKKGNITKSEASYLLAFCNNIGPVYFLSFVLPTLKLKETSIYLFGMYGLPFLYGLFLRYTVYTNISDRYLCPSSDSLPSSEKLPFSGKASSLLAALDESVFSSLSSIARLGGYMIFFNLLFILPSLAVRFLPIKEDFSILFTGGAGCLLEITGGIGILSARAPLWVLCILPFGGLSCIVQTYSMIKDTDLSITEYVMHKMILTAITVFYYLLLAGIYS